MQLPGFLQSEQKGEPSLPEAGDARRLGYAAHGCLIGATLAVLFWFVPIPVATLLWIFGLTAPFGDDMQLAIPFFVALPVIGAGVGAFYAKRARRRK
jgi:hypothetical protein